MAILQDALDRAILSQKIDKLDPEFTIESIKEQLANPLGTTIKRNFLKRMDDHYKEMIEETGEDSDVEMERDALYIDIIKRIEAAYSITIDTDNAKLHKLAKHLYRFFVIDIIDNITQFLEMYIIEHRKDLVTNISNNTNNVTYNSMKDSFIDKNMAIIVSNITEVVDNIANLPLTFNDFLETLELHSDISSVVENIINYHDKNITETDDLYSTMMRPILREDSGFTIILNDLQISLCNKFSKEEVLDNE